MKLTPQNLLDLLGIGYLERPNRLAIHCPFHHDRDPSSGFYLDTELFHCFACGLTLDAVGFYARHQELERDEAVTELEKSFEEIAHQTRADSLRLAWERAEGERILKELRPRLTLKKHAELGELLDKVLLAYERKQINDQQMNLAMKRVYERLTEERDARPDPRIYP